MSIALVLQRFYLPFSLVNLAVVRHVHCARSSTIVPAVFSREPRRHSTCPLRSFFNDSTCCFLSWTIKVETFCAFSFSRENHSVVRHVRPTHSSTLTASNVGIRRFFASFRGVAWHFASYRTLVGLQHIYQHVLSLVCGQ